MPATTEIQATYRVVTPMFCGGVDQQPELRLPSFKGVLRFWWRAAAWARYGDLATIRVEEDALFGSATVGRSRVRLSMPDRPRPASERAVEMEAFGSRNAKPGLHYLAYGLVPQAGKPDDEKETSAHVRFVERNRQHCLVPPFSVTIRAQYRPSTKNPEDGAWRQRTSLQEALETVGLVGGLGARSRKGFGSLVLSELAVDGEPQPVPADAAALVRVLSTRHGGGPPGLPAHTAFTSAAEHLVVGGSGNRFTLLGEFGNRLKAYVGEASATSALQQAVRHRAPFGLPRHVGKENDPPMAPTGGHDRRASPLFVHVHEFAGQPALVLSFFPSRFLPQTGSYERPTIAVGSQKHPVPPEEELYQPVREFLDRLRREWTVLADTRAQEGAR